MAKRFRNISRVLLPAAGIAMAFNMEAFAWQGRQAGIPAAHCQESHLDNAFLGVLDGLFGFSIEGKWKSVGEYGFGQAQPGAIVIFDGTNCNFFSPVDTYAFYKEGNTYKLDCQSLLGTTQHFTVTVVDNNNIKVSQGNYVTELRRVN